MWVGTKCQRTNRTGGIIAGRSLMKEPSQAAPIPIIWTERYDSARDVHWVICKHDDTWEWCLHVWYLGHEITVQLDPVLAMVVSYRRPGRSAAKSSSRAGRKTWVCVATVIQLEAAYLLDRSERNTATRCTESCEKWRSPLKWVLGDCRA